MHKGMLTPREEEIIRQLLTERGIVKYEIVDATNEGRSLPGSQYPCEIEWLSATIATSTSAHSFWLDWIDNKYALTDWDDYTPDLSEIYPYAIGFKNDILAVQQRLRQEES